MYGLKQAAILAFQQLAERLEKVEYSQMLGSSGIWKHETRQKVFYLWVDDFCVKYFNRDDNDLLLNILVTNYKYTVDWTGYNFYGIIFEWNYKEGCVDVSMPGYVKDALRKIKHKPSKKPQYPPHPVNNFQWIMPSMTLHNTPLH